MVSCPKCRAVSVRPSRRHGLGETLAYALLFRRPYRCTGCQHRFVASQVVLVRGSRHRLHVLSLVTMLALGSLYIAIDNRAPMFLAASGGVQRSAAQAALSTRARSFRAQRRAEAERLREKDALKRKARSQVRQSIKRHRSGQVGVDIVQTVSNPKDDTQKLIIEVFKSAGVSENLITHSLKNWDKGVNVMEIGRQWQEQGIDIRAVVRRAESQGFPVRTLMREKDTQH